MLYQSSSRSAQFAPLLLCSLALLLAACEPVESASKAKRDFPQTITARCRHVADGDSLYLQGYQPQIRLWGVDAPERGEPGYQRARDVLQALALQQSLRCDKKDVDKYGRLVARCFLTSGPGAGTEINRALIESGAAKEYCWFSRGFYQHCSTQ